MRGLTARTLWVSVLCAVVVAIPATGIAATRSVVWPDGTVRVSIDAERVYGATRFDTAAAIARSAFPGWIDVSHVVVASGLDKSLVDALAASGLCWAYQAPLLLVADTSVPEATRIALQEIVSANTTVTVSVVGGSAAVSAACVAALEGIVGAGQVEQPFAGADRFTTASMIAVRVSEVASDNPSLVVPDIALIANGSDTHFDALALAAVSARIGAPVLFVTRDAVPLATAATLVALAPGEIIVAGGRAVVSDETYIALGATERWFGKNRYATAVAVAENAIARGWFELGSFGVAASVPDAVVGAMLCARAGMPLLYTIRDRVSLELASFVEERESEVSSCTVFGGASVVSDDALAQLRGDPACPVMLSPRQGYLVAKYARVSVYVGVNTSECRLYVGDALVASRAVLSYGVVDFGGGSLCLPPERNCVSKSTTLKVVHRAMKSRYGVWRIQPARPSSSISPISACIG